MSSGYNLKSNDDTSYGRPMYDGGGDDDQSRQVDPSSGYVAYSSYELPGRSDRYVAQASPQWTTLSEGPEHTSTDSARYKPQCTIWDLAPHPEMDMALLGDAYIRDLFDPVNIANPVELGRSSLSQSRSMQNTLQGATSSIEPIRTGHNINTDKPVRSRARATPYPQRRSLIPTDKGAILQPPQKRKGEFSSPTQPGQSAYKHIVMSSIVSDEAQCHNQPMSLEDNSIDRFAREGKCTVDGHYLRGASSTVFQKFMKSEFSRDKPKSKLTRNGVDPVFTSHIKDAPESADNSGDAVSDADNAGYNAHKDTELGHWHRRLDVIVDNDLAKEVCDSNLENLGHTLEYTDLKPRFGAHTRHSSRVVYDIWKEKNPHIYLSGGLFRFTDNKDLYTSGPISCDCTLYWQINGKRKYKQ